MAAVKASHFITKTSCFTCNGASDSKTMAFQSRRISFMSNHANTYEGLRTWNVVVSREMNMKSTSTQARRGTQHSGRRPWAFAVCGTGMNLVFVGAEVAPWSKSGGLGDVLGGLPPAMAANGHRVMTVAPRYDQYEDAQDTGVTSYLRVGDESVNVRFFHCYERGVDRVFVDHPTFLWKVWFETRGKIHGHNAEIDKLIQLGFSLLCQAALVAPRILDLSNSKHKSRSYGEDVVFIANDWHTSLLSCYLKSLYPPYTYKNAKVALCIHNIAHQGRFTFRNFKHLNLPDTLKHSFDFIDGRYPERIINWMKAGILESDRVLTVSPNYARELLSGIEEGVELDHILRLQSIHGIQHGLDTDEWNPATDRDVAMNYNAATVMKAKAINKEALQTHVGLLVNRKIPVIASVGRLDEQEGLDILAAAIPRFIDENVQVIVLGTGDKMLEHKLTLLEQKFPDKFRALLEFNVPLAHAIMAGADLLALPSRFEPCGLVQLQGMRYGTPSMCATTGGLADTVKEGFTGFHMGPLSLESDAVDGADVQKVVATVKRALKAYGTPAFAEMIQNCMDQELSWKRPAKKWEQFLQTLGVPDEEPATSDEETDPFGEEPGTSDEEIDLFGEEPGTSDEEIDLSGEED